MVFALAIALWNNFAEVAFRNNALWFILALFIGVTILIHYLLISASEKQPGKLVFTFMACTSTKLFVFLILLVLYGWLDRAHAVVFIVGFLVHYVIFSGFEVLLLLQFFKNAKKGG